MWCGCNYRCGVAGTENTGEARDRVGEVRCRFGVAWQKRMEEMGEMEVVAALQQKWHAGEMGEYGNVDEDEPKKKRGESRRQRERE